MNKYENAIKLMEDFCGNGKDNLIAMATISLTPGDNGAVRPSVRMVNAFYENGAFYISSASWKNKTLEIANNDEVPFSKRIPAYSHRTVYSPGDCKSKPLSMTLTER